MGAIVGTRSFHGMIKLFVARLRPQRVSPSLGRLPAVHGRCRNLHAIGLDYGSEVESTPLLRIVRNRAAEFSHLRSEVSYNQRISSGLCSTRI